ncbi:MAG TPA: MobV family relaxase [Terriglobales bacterium]|nr:MobV family relaxase [Terriglobales bacterium]
MPYAILRTAKLKSLGEIAGSLSHTYRTRETPNADPSRATLNEHHGGADPAAVRAAIRARLPEKYRKDAVLCIEYFVGASPEFFQDGGDADAYFSRSVRWLQDRHGADNLVAWSIHRDETSPHLVAYVVPLDSAGKLNAKHFLGGKAKLSAMQTDFAVKVGAQVGLERGIEGSKATHTTIRQYYQALSRPDFKHGRVSAATLEPKVLEKRLLTRTVESPEQVAERLTRAVQAYYKPAVTAATTAALEKRRAQEMAQTAKVKDQALREAEAQLKAERERLADLRALFLDGLTPEQQQALAAQASHQRRENWIAAEAKRREPEQGYGPSPP